MSEELSDYTPLDPAQLQLMRIRGLVVAAALLLLAAVAESMLHRRYGVPRGLLLAPALLAAVYIGALAPGRRYRAWGWRIEGEELRLRRGIVVHVRTVVPLERIQHIDLTQGPLERAFGLSRLVLHTAGTLHSQVTVPGLARETAERIRDEVRARIREAPE